jgi:hypothetical protein
MKVSDEVIVSLTVKFTKEIQLTWYEEMRRVFTSTEALEQQLTEIAQLEQHKIQMK